MNAPVAGIEPGYVGLRLTADEYFDLPDDGNWYELVDGVVVMSPSPTTRHQQIAGIIYGELYLHIRTSRLGLLLFETDMQLQLDAERPVVYRPEVMFVAAARAACIKRRVTIAPDLVVEVVSPDSRNLDTRTKHDDYERAGVREYWIIDPERQAMTFLRLEADRFVEAPVSGSWFESSAVPGFRLDLEIVRAAFRAVEESA